MFTNLIRSLAKLVRVAGPQKRFPGLASKYSSKTPVIYVRNDEPIISEDVLDLVLWINLLTPSSGGIAYVPMAGISGRQYWNLPDRYKRLFKPQQVTMLP